MGSISEELFGSWLLILYHYLKNSTNIYNTNAETANAVYLVIGTSFLKGVLASARKCNKPGLTLGSLKLWSPSWRGPDTRPIHIFLGSEERGFRKQDQSYLGCGENHFENDTHFAFFIWPTAAFISALSWSLVLSFIALVAVILTMFLLTPVSCTFVIISSLRLKIYLVYSCLW